MTAEDFAAWVEHMKATRNWSKRECARQLNCGINQIARWSRAGAPRYIGLACGALSSGIPSWQPIHGTSMDLTHWHSAVPIPAYQLPPEERTRAAYQAVEAMVREIIKET